MRGAAAADGGERRDPSEKREPHTVMWGTNNQQTVIAGQVYKVSYILCIPML